MLGVLAAVLIVAFGGSTTTLIPIYATAIFTDFTISQSGMVLHWLRNKSPAFDGRLEIHESDEHRLQLTWRNQDCTATLDADLRNFGFSVTHKGGGCEDYVTSYR